VTLTVLNPATEEPIAEVEQAGVEEADRAVARAKAAHPVWRAVASGVRARLMRRLTTLVELKPAVGPLVSAEHRAKFASFVDGEPAFRREAPNGCGFCFPSTIVEATNDDRVAREEVFGPVAAVIPFEDEADAIRIANDRPYGLSGSIWTRDGARALRVARAIESGVLSINVNTSVRVQTPFGGFKQSGFGRELGMHALDGYSEVKSVFFSTEG
jgi:acyl-CoA reductase-like NAD-dependent aldehyde dehydrogenase